MFLLLSVAMAQEDTRCVVHGEPVHPYKLMHGADDEPRLRDYRDINRTRKKVFFATLGVTVVAFYGEFIWAINRAPLNDTDALVAGGAAVGTGLLFFTATTYYVRRGLYLDECSNWYTEEQLRELERG